MGWVGQGQHLFWWRILLCKIQPQIPPKKESSPRGHGGRGGWGEFRHARANTKSGQPRRPARSEQNPAQKVSFPFLRKKKGGRKKKKGERNFFGGGGGFAGGGGAGFLSWGFAQRKFEHQS